MNFLKRFLTALVFLLGILIGAAFLAIGPTLAARYFDLNPAYGMILSFIMSLVIVAAFLATDDDLFTCK